jgi:hypothetical protein
MTTARSQAVSWLFSSVGTNKFVASCGMQLASISSVIQPEINRQLAAEGSGFGVAYPEPLFPHDPGWEHRNGISGRRLPDMDLVLEDGARRALYRFLEDGPWVRLRRTPDRETLSNAEWITDVNLVPEGNDGLLANIASVLVRPDGYLAHVRPGEISSSRG